MYKSRIITVSIDRPYEAVFAFLIEPRNFPSWASNLGTSFEHVAGNDWVTQTRTGRVILRFAPPNDWGILDHAVFAEGTEPFVTPMRLVRNGDGAEIVYSLYQRDGMDDDVFESEVEWITSDFHALKAMLESDSMDVGFAPEGETAR